MKCLLLGIVVCVLGQAVGWVKAGSGSSGSDGKVRNGTDFKFECYICSWSSNAEVTNNLDTCSTNKFKIETSDILPCEHGCQTVSYRNAKTKDLQHFYRNCLKVEKGSDPVDRCIPTKDSIYGLENVCQCLSTLCNQSPTSHPGSYWIVIAAHFILASVIILS